jgi:urease accessory protein UreF
LTGLQSFDWVSFVSVPAFSETPGEARPNRSCHPPNAELHGSFQSFAADVWKRFDEILKEKLTPNPATTFGAVFHALRVSQTRL